MKLGEPRRKIKDSSNQLETKGDWEVSTSEGSEMKIRMESLHVMAVDLNT